MPTRNPMTTAYKTIKKKLVFLESQVAINHFNEKQLPFIKQEIHAFKVALLAIQLAWDYGYVRMTNRQMEYDPLLEYQANIESQLEMTEKRQANLLANHLSAKKRPADYGRDSD